MTCCGFATDEVGYLQPRSVAGKGVTGFHDMHTWRENVHRPMPNVQCRTRKDI